MTLCDGRQKMSRKQAKFLGIQNSKLTKRSFVK